MGRLEPLPGEGLPSAPKVLNKGKCTKMLKKQSLDIFKLAEREGGGNQCPLCSLELAVQKAGQRYPPQYTEQEPTVSIAVLILCNLSRVDEAVQINFFKNIDFHCFSGTIIPIYISVLSVFLSTDRLLEKKWRWNFGFQCSQSIRSRSRR